MGDSDIYVDITGDHQMASDCTARCQWTGL